MSDTGHIKLVSSRGDATPPRVDTERYRLLVTCHAEAETAIHVYDRQLRRVILKWRGAVARGLLRTNILRPEQRSSGSHDCDKSLIRKLTIAASRIRIRLQRRGSLDSRLDELHRDIPLFHRRIALMLFDHPGHHFSEQEIVCLLLLEFPFVGGERIAASLRDLARWRIIQCVEIDEHTRFYDIDTRPHLHVYCPRANELRDAPTDGVVRVGG